MRTLVTGALQLTEQQQAQLCAMGMQLTLHPDEKQPVISPEQYEAVVCNGLFLSNPIEQFTSLRVIQLTSAGLDRVPLAYIRDNAITLYNARGVYSIPMAEFAVCGVMQLYKNAVFFHKNQQQCNWEKNRKVRELAGKTVCIVGCGSVGTHCAARFSALGCTCIGVDLYPVKDGAYQRVLPLEQLKQALSDCDIAVLTLPLNEQTQHLMGASCFAQLKKDAVLVNIARGGVIDTAALLQWLREHPEAGAVLDVFEQEPLPADSPLWTLDNVLLTPHNSFIGEHNGERLFHLVCENLEQWKANEEA